MNTINHTFRNGLLAVAAVAAMYSCTDAWDEHYDTAGNAAGITYNGTTMQAIQEKAPNFAKVLQAAGFDRELNSSNEYTVWAPQIDDATATQYIQLIQNGKKDVVIKKFIKSHIARYNYSLTNTADTLTLANTKLVALGNAENPKFGNADITQANISCKNGVLHIINKVNPFINNIYELIEERQAESEFEHTLYSFLDDYDSLLLDETKSVYRGVDENGNRIYVDSVTERFHQALNQACLIQSQRPLIYEEDSNFTAIIPSPAAYSERYQIASNLLNFNKAIVDKVKDGVADSLNNYWANMFAMRDLYFNNNTQKSPQDSITSSYYYDSPSRWEESVYYKPFTTGILAPGKYTERVECSNGVAYLVDEYPMSVTDQFFKKMTIWPSRSNLYVSDDPFATRQHNDAMSSDYASVNSHTLKLKRDEDGNIIEPYELDTVNYSSIMKVYDFMACEPKTSTGAPNYTFMLSNTLSGTYEVQVVLMPYWLKDRVPDPENIKTQYKFQTTIFEKLDDGKNAGEFDSKGTMLIPTDDHLNGSNYALSKNFTEDGTILYTDTISLGEYTFQNSYYDQNEGGVLIQFKPNGTSKQIRDRELTKSMNIIAIILKPKFDERWRVNAEALETKRR